MNIKGNVFIKRCDDCSCLQHLTSNLSGAAGGGWAILRCQRVHVRTCTRSLASVWAQQKNFLSDAVGIFHVSAAGRDTGPADGHIGRQSNESVSIGGSETQSVDLF